MSVVKWGPLKELEEMRRDMDRIFDEFFLPTPRRRRGWMARPEEGMIVPNIELYDKGNALVVKAEVPGVKKEDLDLTITSDTLTLKGEVKKEEETKEETYYISERNYGRFARTLTLPSEVESEKASASFNNGILEITLPKKEEAKPKEIKVQVK